MENTRNGLYLKAIGSDDFERLFKWHNDAALYTTLGGHFRYVSRDSETEWLRRRIDARDEVNLAICLREPPAHIGNIYLRSIDWVARNAELHTFIAEQEYRGKGYGSTAVRLVMKHAFKDLGLLRLYLYVLANNAAAIATYEKCGFVREGRLRHHVFKQGAFEDMIVMGVCNE